MFSPDDLSQLRAQGIGAEAAAAQLGRISRGFPGIRLDRPCTVGDGLLRLNAEERSEAIVAFERARDAGRISKFVPASGAASRMFQALLSVHGSGIDLGTAALERLEVAGPEREEALKRAGLSSGDAELCLRFLRAAHEFPFAPELASALGLEGRDAFADLLAAGGGRRILEALLRDPGLGFASLPKGLIPFHHYSDGSWTPFGEHVAEAWELLGEGSADCGIRIHFTVPPGFEGPIRSHLDDVVKLFPEARFVIDLSIQSPATDTLAGDLDGGPFRTGDGRLVFRPAGHGALLTNLGALGGDIVLLKNVDNIARRSWRQRHHHFRMLLAGLLVLLEERVSVWLAELDEIEAALSGPPGEDDPFGPQGVCGGAASAPVFASVSGVVPSLRSEASHQIDQIEASYAGIFCRRVAPSDDGAAIRRIERLRALLERPIRVCGMVANEGEPGGGPFWVRHPDGSIDIQIVELSQIDRRDRSQAEAVEGATHFNPVDLAVSLKDSHGRPRDLSAFVDPDTGIVAEKSDGGRRLRALELPGLWNGAMAAWNTVFVEIPIETFTPVKTVLDLLRDPHRGDF